jgi:hypothetical protein
LTSSTASNSSSGAFTTSRCRASRAR